VDDPRQPPAEAARTGAPDGLDFDVIVIGGALAGAATATLLLRGDPTLRVLIAERATTFGRRVGESTVEVSAYFLCRVLGLTRYLQDAHIVKQGMRFWFASAATRTVADCSELGNRFQSRLPAYQVDRSTLDEEVLARATALGAAVWRDVAVKQVSLRPGGEQTVTLRRGDEHSTLRARWVVDASGRSALLARQEGWFQSNDDHPIAAVWARWSNVGDLDGFELAERFPAWAAATYAVRGTATNHLTGDGWWAWVIPLKGGDVSIGVVYDERRVRWPSEGPPGERLKRFLEVHPVGRELVGNARWNERDVHQGRRLAFRSRVFAGDGFALVGDAAAFMDPLYSPGMDWLAYTVTASAGLILRQRRGEPIARAIELHNQGFSRSYEHWFRAIYFDKYEYLGEYDLMRVAFQLDVGLYFTGVVSRPFDKGAVALSEPIFSNRGTLVFAAFMGAYNRRLAAIARGRRTRGELGRANSGRRLLLRGFTHKPATYRALLRPLAQWARLEIDEAWRRWRNPSPPPRDAAAIPTSSPRPSDGAPRLHDPRVVG
jgi:flavin-dependent dehydrogenase